MTAPTTGWQTDSTASGSLGLSNIAADVRQGTRRDAVLYSVGANALHGYPRSNDDKRRAVMTLLRDDEWSGWSDSEIARRCCVDHKTVGRLRAEIAPTHLGNSQVTERTYTTKHGTQATMSTAAIGRRIDAPPPAPAVPSEPPWTQTDIEDFAPTPHWPRFPPEHRARVWSVGRIFNRVCGHRHGIDGQHGCGLHWSGPVATNRDARCCGRSVRTVRKSIFDERTLTGASFTIKRRKRHLDRVGKWAHPKRRKQLKGWRQRRGFRPPRSGAPLTSCEGRAVICSRPAERVAA
jgi:hypothetical protein